MRCPVSSASIESAICAAMAWREECCVPVVPGSTGPTSNAASGDAGAIECDVICGAVH